MSYLGSLIGSSDQQNRSRTNISDGTFPLASHDPSFDLADVRDNIYFANNSMKIQANKVSRFRAALHEIQFQPAMMQKLG
jgi:hypothetical protein